jgi:hypothetical protein
VVSRRTISDFNSLGLGHNQRLEPLLTSGGFVFLPAGTGDVGQDDRLQVVPFTQRIIKHGLEANHA